jgi:hypothetical protein
MIVRKVDGGVSLVRQPDHARQCRELAAAWRPELIGVQLDPAILDAVLEHDNGWIEWDAKSPLNLESGLPYQFFAMPVTEHLEIFSRGVERASAIDPYVGLIVSMHGVGLYNGRYGLVPAFGRRYLNETEQAQADAFIREQEAIQSRLRERIKGDSRYRDLAEERAIWDVYLTLQMWDWLSLSCLTGPLQSVKLGPLPSAANVKEIQFEPAGGESIRLSPWPFAIERVVTTVPLRRLQKTKYESQKLLDRELARSRDDTITFEMTPG